MTINRPVSESGSFNPRIVFGFVLCCVGISLAMFGFAAAPPNRSVKEAAVATAGSWSIVSSPNTSTTLENDLYGVSCPSPSNCWAVGAASNGSGYDTLIQRWDGTSWTIVPSPNPSSTYNVLFGVTCWSASECWAVGWYSGTQTNNAPQTLIEHWDGTSWTVVPSPNGDTRQDVLTGVACASASNCWAVGYHYSHMNEAGIFIYETLVEHWDGSSWSIAASENTSATQNILYGVTCTSTSNCQAVGYTTANTPVGPFQTLIEQWDGVSWKIVASANTDPAHNNYLFAGACASSSDCRAVGYSNTPNVGIALTLVQRWNGNTWAIESSPNVSTTQNNAFFGVACPAASNCWAVGYNSASGVIQNLIEKWDGSSWTIFPSPNTNTAQSNVLESVACTSSYDCWAVGYYNNGTANQTLIEHYSAPPPPKPTSIVSRKNHGASGTFDVDLPLTGARGVECRSGGATNDYTLVFTFPNNTTVASASVSSGTGSVSGSALGPNPNQYTVNLTGVTDAQYLTVTLNGVLDSTGGSGNVVGPQMGVLVGDVNASGVVTSGDTNLCKAQALQQVTTANFRNDINASGSITTGDVNIIKQNALSQLPTPP
jgi:hypothetical protein